MAIALVSTGSVVSSDTVNTIEVTPPASISDGNLLCMVGYCDDNQALSTPESGWTKDSQVSNAINSDSAGAFFYKVASSESGNYTLDMAGPAGNMRGVIFQLSGQNATVIDATSVTGADAGLDSDTIDPGAITTVTDGAWVLSIIAMNQSGGGALTVPTGYTKIAEAADADNFGVAYKLVSSAGSEDPSTWSNLGATADSGYITAAIRPAAASGNPWYYYAQQ
jgi:hypothetical protein